MPTKPSSLLTRWSTSAPLTFDWTESLWNKAKHQSRDGRTRDRQGKGARRQTCDEKSKTKTKTSATCTCTRTHAHVRPAVHAASSSPSAPSPAPAPATLATVLAGTAALEVAVGDPVGRGEQLLHGLGPALPKDGVTAPCAFVRGGKGEWSENAAERGTPALEIFTPNIMYAHAYMRGLFIAAI